MKHNKIIYLTAFLLSLSLILLLEASSLRLLAEDIKPKEKKEIEIELLLSASKPFAEQNGMTAEKSKENRPAKKVTTEVDKNSSAVKEVTTEKTQVAKKVEEKIKKEVVENKKVTKAKLAKAEGKEQAKKEKIIEKEKIKNQEIEKEAKTETEAPAWLKDSTSKPKTENKEKNRKKFNLDNFLEKIENEKEAKNNNQPKSTTMEAADAKSEEEAEQVTDGSNSADPDSQKNEVNSEQVTAENNKNVMEVENNEHLDKVYDLRQGNSANLEKPGIKKYSSPAYPSNLRKRNIEGRVIVSLRIDKKGKAHDIKINESSGYDSFDQAALKAVSSWEFKPAEKEGEKVEVLVNLPIRFNLN